MTLANLRLEVTIYDVDNDGVPSECGHREYFFDLWDAAAHFARTLLWRRSGIRYRLYSVHTGEDWTEEAEKAAKAMRATIRVK